MVRYKQLYILAMKEYRAKAAKFRGDEILRRCYVELAWLNRKYSREQFITV